MARTVGLTTPPAKAEKPKKAAKPAQQDGKKAKDAPEGSVEDVKEQA